MPPHVLYDYTRRRFDFDLERDVLLISSLDRRAHRFARFPPASMFSNSDRLLLTAYFGFLTTHMGSLLRSSARPGAQICAHLLPLPQKSMKKILMPEYQ